MNTDNAVQKIWGLCHILRGDGVSYHEYITELTYLLFLKIAEETKTENLLPSGRRWSNLLNYEGRDLLTFYQEMLTYLGAHAPNDSVRKIYAFPTTVFSHSENLKAVIAGIAKLDWHSITMDGMGDIYEGLLAKNSQDARSGAGQYFTPRALVDCIVRLTRPALGEVIQDPATGTGGFLISADHFVRGSSSASAYKKKPPRYEGVEIEKGTYRICLMNSFLHRLNARLILGDALTSDATQLAPADLILANPPFGSKAGSARKQRNDIVFSNANKQLAFLQHIYSSLKPGGRAAVVLPDNVLFEEGVGQKVRRDLMDRCNVHTILRLPAGIFYSAGVKTNVLFFTRGQKSSGNTKTVWVYDMRHGTTKFGKRRPLLREDFSQFEAVYGSETGERTKPKGRPKLPQWRSFSRKEIAQRSDNLDLSWLGEAGDAADGVSFELEEIAAALLTHLRTAVSEVEAITDELESARTGE